MVGKYMRQKRIFKNRWQEVERVAELEIVLNQHILVSIVGQEIEEKVENYSKYIL